MDRATEFTVGVYRVQAGDTPELQVERHRARGAALRAEFTNAEDIEVRDWGDTEAEEPHELVELVVDVLGSPVVQGAVGSVVTWIGVKLGESAIDAGIAEGFKALARRIFRTQRDEPRVSDAWIRGPQGSPTMQLYPPEWGPGGKTVAAIVFSDGSRVEYHPPPGEWTGDPELEPPAHRLGPSSGSVNT